MQNRKLAIEPLFDQACELHASRSPEFTGTALIYRWQTTCALAQGQVHISGLSATLTDVMVRLQRSNGEERSFLLRPEKPSADLTESAPAALAYFTLGVEHLVFGIDHVLFVIGLVLFIRAPLMLFKTVTAFTVAHSVTLALSVLGWVRVPQAPVEAIIALSILFLARELVVEPARQSALTRTTPWIMALLFGLLHGFGFAGALADIGLPKEQLALSLLLFNLGIEAGQIAIIVALLAAFWIFQRALSRTPPTRFFALAMGCVAGMWTIDRVLMVV